MPNKVAMNLHILQCCVPSISPQVSQSTVTLVSYVGHQIETSCHEPELKLPLSLLFRDLISKQFSLSND